MSDVNNIGKLFALGFLALGAISLLFGFRYLTGRQKFQSGNLVYIISEELSRKLLPKHIAKGAQLAIQKGIGLLLALWGLWLLAYGLMTLLVK